MEFPTSTIVGDFVYAFDIRISVHVNIGIWVGIRICVSVKNFFYIYIGILICSYDFKTI